MCQKGQAQGFMNLDFEQAVVTNPPGLNGFPGFALESDAIPGWTATPINNLSGNRYIGYDSISLGGAAMFLEDSNAPSGGGPLPIEGNYSVLLEYQSASIGQTGTIPITAQSLTFWGNVAGDVQGNTLQIYFNNQALSFEGISNALNYTVYAANILPFAGQTGQLLFGTTGHSIALLDNFQFSSIPIPEPGEFALAALGALLLGFRRWKSNAIQGNCSVGAVRR